MKKNITIVDIANEANVSISTVSRVLTGKAKVTEDKRRRVQEAIEKHGFKPNMLARGLIQNRTNLIGIMVADIRNPYYSSLVVSCEQAAKISGYNLMVCNSFSDRVLEFELLEKLANQRVDAIIIIGGTVDDVETDAEFAQTVNRISETIPILITGKLDNTNCTQINIDGIKAMSLVMQHLHKNPSLRRIALAGGNPDKGFARELRKSFRMLLGQYSMEYVPEFDVPNVNYDDNGGYEAMNKILENGRPDAVIAINDFTAAGVIKSIYEHGLKVPEDIKIVSFDDTFISTLMNPHLTSISYNYQMFGDTFITAALKIIDGEEVPKEILIMPKLVERESC